MGYNREALKKEIMGIAHQFAQSYKAITQLDYQQRLHELKPGDKVPENDGFVYTGKYLGELEKEKNEAIEHAKGLIESYSRDAKREMVTPPDAAALSYINSMKTRKTIDVDEMAEAFMNYGDNWTCYQMLTEIRDEQQKVNWMMSGIKPVHSIDGYREVGSGLMNNLSTYLDVFSTGRFQPGYVSDRLDTLDQISNTIVGTHGESCPDISTFISRAPSHVAVRQPLAGDVQC